MPNNDAGLAGDLAIDTTTNPTTVYGQSRYLKLGALGSSTVDDSSTIIFSAAATKNYNIKSISISQGASIYTHAYAIFISHPDVSVAADQGIDITTESDNAATADFNETKITYTRRFNPSASRVDKTITPSGYTLRTGESLFVRTTNNIPAGGAADAAVVVIITLTPTA